MVSLVAVRSRLASAKKKSGARTLEQLVALFTTYPLSTDDFVPVAPARPPEGPAQLHMRRGGELVHLTEQHYVDVLRLVLCFVLVGSVSQSGSGARTRSVRRTHQHSCSPRSLPRLP
jgi:hypothetical protein